MNLNCHSPDIRFGQCLLSAMLQVFGLDLQATQVPKSNTSQRGNGYNLRSVSQQQAPGHLNVSSSSLNNHTSSSYICSSAFHLGRHKPTSSSSSSSTRYPRCMTSHSLPQHFSADLESSDMKRNVLQESKVLVKNHQVPSAADAIGTEKNSSSTTNIKKNKQTTSVVNLTNDDSVISLDDTADDIILVRDNDAKVRNSNLIIINDESDIINLDASFEDLTAFGRRDRVSDASNNSNGNSTSATSTSVDIYGATSSRIACKVLNCEAEFTSEGSLGQHMNLFQHSPCNPCLLARDCKLAPDPVCFMCPECDRQFQTQDDCRAHMRSANHLQFYPPLSIAGYMCPQCLYVFPSHDICVQHIDHLKHRDTCYPFADDQSAQSPVPVPIAEELLEDLKSKARKVPFSVSCLECLMDLVDAAALRQHMQETNNAHPTSVFSDTNLVDMFASYLAGYNCNTCRRLFTGQLKEAAKHQCAKGVLGTIVENDIQSFRQFIKQCAFTVIKSVDVEINRPGPSYQGYVPSSQYKRSARAADQSETQGACGQSASSRPVKKLCDDPSNKKMCKDVKPECSSTMKQEGGSYKVAEVIPSGSGISCDVPARKTMSECDVICVSDTLPGPSYQRHRNPTGPQQSKKMEQLPGRRFRSRSPIETPFLSPISTENLKRMKNIIFLDLDNWAGFFSKLPRALPDLNFIWAFFGGRRVWVEPRRCHVFNAMKMRRLFHLHEQCGNSKDAADFAIVLSVGQMDVLLPNNIAFTILSGDTGFCEVERQMKNTARKAVVINPHRAHQFSNEMLYTMVTSVTDT